MKDILKNSIIGAFALFGLITIISGAANQQASNEVYYGIPESHEWELYRGEQSSYTYVLNKKTGEVRKYPNGDKTYTVPSEKTK